MKKGFNFVKLFGILLFIILIPILLINLYLTISSLITKDKIPSIFGYKPLMVVTGSMEDTIMSGDFILSKDYVYGDHLNKDDIITFRDQYNSIITHRIVKIENVDGENRYYTKGDNNNTGDSSYVTDEKIEGIFVYRSAVIGSIYGFLQTPAGTISLMMLILTAGLIIYFFGFNNARKVNKLV